MGGGIAVESLSTVDCGDAGRKPLLLEKAQVPVDRTHRQIGDLGFQLGKYGLRGRVRLGLLQVSEDRIPLTEVLIGWLHTVTSFLNENNSYLHLEYITPFFICQHFFEKIFYKSNSGLLGGQ